MTFRLTTLEQILYRSLEHRTGLRYLASQTVTAPPGNATACYPCQLGVLNPEKHDQPNGKGGLLEHLLPGHRHLKENKHIQNHRLGGIVGRV